MTHASVTPATDAANPAWITAPAPTKTAHRRLDGVAAALQFRVKTGERPAIFVAQPGEGDSRRTGRYAEQVVSIRNGRLLRPAATLDREGFALQRAETAVADFYDEDEVRDVYYPEIVDLVKAASGASHVHVFDHTRRVDGGASDAARALRAPVRVVHNDYTVKSGPQRVRDLLDPDEAEARLQQRFAEINVWRPVRGPVRRSPLAFADAQSVAPDDLVAVDLVYSDRTGEIYEVAHNPAQRWLYYPDMTRDEVLFIKGYDSLDDGRARFTPHSAFDDPNTLPEAPPRESIEVRTLAFFGPDGPAV